MSDQTNFDNNLGIEIDDFTEQTRGASILAFLAKWFLVVFSAITTALFFMEYGHGVFMELAGDAAPIVAGIAGALLVDGLAQVWAYMRAHHANTVDQMTTARQMSWLNTITSIIITVILFALKSNFEVGVHNTDGTLTTLGQNLNTGGVIVMVGALAVNFLAIFYYADQSAQNRVAVQSKELTTMVNDTRHKLEKKRIQMSLAEMITALSAAFPELTGAAGTAAGDAYTRSKFAAAAPAAPVPADQSKRLLDVVVYDPFNAPVRHVGETHDWNKAMEMARQAAKTIPPGHTVEILGGGNNLAFPAEVGAAQTAENPNGHHPTPAHQ